MHDLGFFHKEKLQTAPLWRCFFSRLWEVYRLDGIFNQKGFFLSGGLGVKWGWMSA